jgi:predicted ATPase
LQAGGFARPCNPKLAENEPRQAFKLLTQAVAQRRAINALEGLPWLLTLLARVAARLGRSAEAWRYLAEASQLLVMTDERMAVVEARYKVPGDLLYVAGDLSGAEWHYRQAMAVPEQQSVRLPQLWVSINLARLWLNQGKGVEAHDLLAPIYGWFTEGLDTPVLREAKALLDELATT